MRSRNRVERVSVYVAPEKLDRVLISRALWFETDEEIAAGLAWTERKAELLRWLRRQMARKLTQRERRCVELYYFKAMTLEEVGREMGLSAATACRTLRHSIHKLRDIAEKNPSWRKKNIE